MKLWKKNPKQERSKEVVDSILQATTHILESEDIQKISTNKIADKAGVGIGSLYQYFLNKESILDSVFNKMIEKNLNFYDQQLRDIKTLQIDEFLKIIIENSFLYFMSQKGYLKTLYAMQAALGKSDTIIKFRLKLSEKMSSTLKENFVEFKNHKELEKKIFIILCQNFGIIHTYIHTNNSPFTKEELIQQMLISNKSFLYTMDPR